MGNIQTTMTEGLATKIAFTIPVLGGIKVSESVLVNLILSALIIVLVLLATRNLKPDKPGRLQSMLEAMVGFINGFCKENIGRHWRHFAPWIGTITIYLTFANLCGILGLTPPTKDVSITASLAITSVFLIYGSQFRFLGAKGGFKRFAEPIPLLLPINLMEIGIRPLSLCMRLFGNVLGAFIIMELLKAVVPVIVPAAFSLYFDIFDGLIQVIVFVFLTTVFTGEAINEEE